MKIERTVRKIHKCKSTTTYLNRYHLIPFMLQLLDISQSIILGPRLTQRKPSYKVRTLRKNTVRTSGLAASVLFIAAVYETLHFFKPAVLL